MKYLLALCAVLCVVTPVAAQQDVRDTVLATPVVTTSGKVGTDYTHATIGTVIFKVRRDSLVVPSDTVAIHDTVTKVVHDTVCRAGWTCTPPAAPPPPPPPPPSNRVGFYVSPSGSGSTCSQSSPCALSTAIGKTGMDTVWMRQGSYPGFTLTTANRVVRAYPGERVTIKGPIGQRATNGVIWGLEVVSNNGDGINASGVGSKLINNVIHDAEHQGIGMYWNTQGGEISGNIVYNNGSVTNKDHGIYFNSRGPTPLLLTDNVVFDNWAYGMHAYSSTPGDLAGPFVLDGNVTGWTGLDDDASALLIGGSRVGSVTITNHRAWKMVGYIAADIGRKVDSYPNGTASVSGIFVGTPGLAVSRFSSAATSGAQNLATAPNDVQVRPNKWEPGRANVTVFNGSGAKLVMVNLSSVVKVGQSYEVRSVCDLWGTPVASGTYAAPILVPMTAIPAPVPQRAPKRQPPPCGGAFGVFLVTAK